MVEVLKLELVMEVLGMAELDESGEAIEVEQ